MSSHSGIHGNRLTRTSCWCFPISTAQTGTTPDRMSARIPPPPPAKRCKANLGLSMTSYSLTRESSGARRQILPRLPDFTSTSFKTMSWSFLSSVSTFNYLSESSRALKATPLPRHTPQQTVMRQIHVAESLHLSAIARGATTTSRCLTFCDYQCFHNSFLSSKTSGRLSRIDVKDALADICSPKTR